jgi:hypothetical protein
MRRARMVLIDTGAKVVSRALMPGANHDERRKAGAQQRQQRRRTLQRPMVEVDLALLPEGSVIGPATLEAIRQGRMALVVDRGGLAPTLAERRRQSRWAKTRPRAESMVCPWVPLVTPIPQYELDRLRAAKRAARQARETR